MHSGDFAAVVFMFFWRLMFTILVGVSHDLCKSLVCWLVPRLVVTCCVIVSVNKFYVVWCPWAVHTVCFDRVSSTCVFWVHCLRSSHMSCACFITRATATSWCFWLLTLTFVSIFISENPDFNAEKCANYFLKAKGPLYFAYLLTSTYASVALYGSF